MTSTSSASVVLVQPNLQQIHFFNWRRKSRFVEKFCTHLRSPSRPGRGGEERGREREREKGRGSMWKITISNFDLRWFFLSDQKRIQVMRERVCECVEERARERESEAGHNRRIKGLMIITEWGRNNRNLNTNACNWNSVAERLSEVRCNFILPNPNRSIWWTIIFSCSP